MRNIIIIGGFVNTYMEDQTEIRNPMVESVNTLTLIEGFERFYASDKNNHVTTIRFENAKVAFIKSEFEKLRTLDHSTIIFIYNGIGALSRFDYADWDKRRTSKNKLEAIHFHDEVLWDWEFNNLLAQVNLTNKFYIFIDSCYAGGFTVRSKTLERFLEDKPLKNVSWKQTKAQMYAFFTSADAGEAVDSHVITFFDQIFPLIEQWRFDFVRDSKILRKLLKIYNKSYGAKIYMKQYNIPPIEEFLFQ